MKRSVQASTILGGILVLMLHAAPAQAQATRTWVSGVGDDVNPCSRTAPCKTFAGAISKTAAGGIINCLDPGGFGAVTITKSITIDCESQGGGILASGTNGIIVNGGSIQVVIRNLAIEGAETGLSGISFLNGSVLHVENVKITQFKAGVTASGIRVATPAGVTAELHVSDTSIIANGNATNNGGILIAPASTGNVRLSLNRVKISDNSAGIVVVAPAAGFIRGEVRDTVVAGNTNDGITATSTGSAVRLMINNVSVVGNTTGIIATGAGTSLAVGNSTITSNNTGVSVTAPAQILTYATNKNNFNIASDGAFTQPPLNQQ